MRRTRTGSAQLPDESTTLLHELLSAPVPLSSNPLRPVVLRSTAQQRSLALRPFLLRTWLDYALQHAERLLSVAVVFVFLYWLADGYGRDWLRTRTVQAVDPTLSITAAHRHQAPAPTASSVGAILLPYTTPDMEQPPEHDFLEPQRVALPVEPSDIRPNRLVLSAIGVDTPVTEVFVVNGEWQVADYAAGYHHGTALPGEAGNTVMAGHAGLRGGVFRDLGRLTVGDEATVEAGGWRYRYRIRSVQNVWPHQVEVMASTPTKVLTLITCTAWDTQRLVVVADLIDARPIIK